MNIQCILATKGSHAVTIRPQQSVRDAVVLLIKHNIGALVVVDENCRPIGLLGERDIARAAAMPEPIYALPVSALMSREMVTGIPEDDLEAVAHTMTEKRVRHIPVVEDGRLVGLVSIGDVVKARLDRYEGELYTLQTQVMAASA